MLSGAFFIVVLAFVSLSTVLMSFAILSVVMPGDGKQSTVSMSVIMPIFVILAVIMLSVVMLNG